MAKTRAVGIDLGTTYSAMAWVNETGHSALVPNDEGDLLTPSVVLFDDAGVVVGKEAKKVAILYPDRVAACVKRDMGRPVYSKPIGRQSRKMYIERFIHGEIYKARDDVAAVLHNHSPALIPFTVTDVPLRPLTQVAGFLGSGVPVFDIRDVDSGPDLLIANGEQASALAHTLGKHAVALLRGHGAVVVADTLQQLVWRGIYAELNARQQLEALRIGSVRYLSAAEAERPCPA